MTFWETIKSNRTIINEELIYTILNGLCKDAWVSVVISDEHGILIKILENQSFYQDSSNSIFEYAAEIKINQSRTKIGKLCIQYNIEANKELVLTASKLISHSIEHRIERLLLDKQLKIRDKHTSSINSIFDLLTTSQDLEELWDKLNDVLNQVCPIINASGSVFLEIKGGECTIKSTSIYYYNISNRSTEISQYFLKFLVSKKPKIYKLSPRNLGETILETAISKGRKIPKYILVVPIPLDVNSEFRLVFFLTSSKVKELPAPANDDLKLLSSATGRLTLAYNTIIRIQEQIFISHQKEKLVKEKNEYIHVITHQLIQPLSSLVAYCEALHDTNISFEKKQQFLKWIPSIARYWAGFVYTVAWASRQDKGIFNDSPEVHFKSCKITPMLINCAIDMQPFAQEQQGIHIDVNTKLCELVDKQVQPNLSELQVRQAIMCLIHNAVKYSFAKSRIVIKAAVNSGKLIITVANHGIPIQADEREKIFNKGGRTELAVEIDPGGTGLGLFIVHEVMQLHNGIVKVESNEIAPNKYLTIFSLIFPLESKLVQEIR